MNDLDTRLRHMAREEETPVPKDFDENLTRTLAQLPARKRRRIPRAAARRIFSGRPYPVVATAIGRCSVRGPWWCSWISPS